MGISDDTGTIEGPSAAGENSEEAETSAQVPPVAPGGAS